MKLIHICKLLRIHQYTKNLFVFLPIFFSGKLFFISDLWKTIFVFCSFCATASIIYILNDLQDREEDKQHPIKRLRPIASGAISPKFAFFCILILIIISLFFNALIQTPICSLIIICYFILNLYYIYKGKQKSIIDITCIAIGFVLRACAGALVIHQELSHWLVLMVFILSMFLGLGKRWDDVCLVEKNHQISSVRKSISGYSSSFILSGMTFLSTMNTLCYIMYTVSPEIQIQYTSNLLYLSSFWVILGNLRYLQIAFVDHNTVSPTKIMLHDKGIQVCVLLWILHILILRYS